MRVFAYVPLMLPAAVNAMAGQVVSLEKGVIHADLTLEPGDAAFRKGE